MDRMQQQLELSITQPAPSGDGGDFISGNEDQNDQEHNQGSGSGHKDRHGRRGTSRRGHRGMGKGGGFQGSAKKKDPTVDDMAAIKVRQHESCQPFDEPDEHQKTIHMASNRNVALLYLQYDVYDSPIPALFLRSETPISANTSPFSPRSITTYGPEECLTIVLTSEIGQGATGIVHRGTLELGISDGAMELDVVVKLAFSFEQRDALKSEYDVYCCLRSKGISRGIATSLGVFDDSEGGACALVMLYAGVPLTTVPRRRNLSISEW